MPHAARSRVCDINDRHDLAKEDALDSVDGADDRNTDPRDQTTLTVPGGREEEEVGDGASAPLCANGAHVIPRTTREHHYPHRRGAL